MATQEQWNSIPDVDEQTQLDNTIKIRWSGRDRRRVRRSLVASLESNFIERAIALPIMTRQKTQIVIKTEEELDAFEKALRDTGCKFRVSRRIKDEIQKQLNGASEENEESGLPEKAQRRKEETDMGTLLEDIIKPHARKKCEEVWPGGTVDVDEITWFWNPQLTSSAGRAYCGARVPRKYASGHLAIGLAPVYYYKHGLDEMLEVVRHELIHIWSYEHPDVANVGHGPKFKQWLEDMETHRHCKNW